MSILRRIVPKKGRRRESPLFIIVILIVIALLFLARTGLGQSIESRSDAEPLFHEANALYHEQEFAEALALYERIMTGGQATREVFFNAGNAAHNVGDAGLSVLYYKRALLLDPHFSPARQNLESVQPATNDPDGELFTEAVLRGFARTSPWIWLLLAEAAFLLLIACGVFVIRSLPGSEVRGVWWSRFAGAAVAFAVAAGLFAAHGQTSVVAGDAVVLRDGAVTRLGPAERFGKQMELPAGTVLHLSGDPRDGWVGFRLMDGATGFIQTDVITRI